MLSPIRTASILPRTLQKLGRSATWTAVRTLADVQVEHGRNQWKTYGDLSNYKPGKFQIKTYNKISPVGLARFPKESYDIRSENEEAHNAHAILLRSYKLKEEEVAHTVRAIAR